MIDGDVCDAAVPAQEVGALPMDVHDGKHLVVFKGVEAPPFFGDPRFRGLAIFNDDTPESVGILKKRPGEFKAWLFLSGRLFVLAVAAGSGSQLLRLVTPGASFVLLAILAPSGIVKLPLRVLSLEGLKVSVPALRLPTPRPLVRASPLVGMAPVPVTVAVPGSPVFLACRFPVLPILPASPGMILALLLHLDR